MSSILGLNLPKQGQPSNQKKVSWVRYRILLRHLDLDHVGCPNFVPLKRGHQKSAFVRVKKMAPFFGVGAGSLIDSKSFVHRPRFVV